MFYITEAIASDPKILSITSLFTDGRFSRATFGSAIGYVSPEASEGEPIALSEENDLILIDVEERKLEIVGVKGKDLSEDEIEKFFVREKLSGKS